MTKILPIRLTEKEFQMLDEILASENCESENRSEWIRLLLYREWNKRKGLGVLKLIYQTANRIGGRLPALIPRSVIHSRTSSSRRERITHKIYSYPNGGYLHVPVSHRQPLDLKELSESEYQRRNLGIKTISRLTTCASGGTKQRTKFPRVTRRAGDQTLRAK
jgi:hypothetical protein